MTTNRVAFGGVEANYAFKMRTSDSFSVYVVRSGSDVGKAIVILNNNGVSKGKLSISGVCPSL